MDTNRFLMFLQTFDRIVKNIKRIEMAYMRDFGLRSVHASCLLYMDLNREGVTVTQLSKECESDKSLISRTVKELFNEGFIVTKGSDNDKNYNKKYILTEKSDNVLTGLKNVICKDVVLARENISPEDMKIFYDVLGTFESNISLLMQDNA